MYGAPRRPSWAKIIDVPTMRSLLAVDEDEDVLPEAGVVDLAGEALVARSTISRIAVAVVREVHRVEVARDLEELSSSPGRAARISNGIMRGARYAPRARAPAPIRLEGPCTSPFSPSPVAVLRFCCYRFLDAARREHPSMTIALDSYKAPTTKTAAEAASSVLGTRERRLLLAIVEAAIRRASGSRAAGRRRSSASSAGSATCPRRSRAACARRTSRSRRRRCRGAGGRSRRCRSRRA